LLRGSLAIGFGLGLFSVVYFLSPLWQVTNLAGLDGAVLAVLAAAFAVRRRTSSAHAGVSAGSDGQWPPRFQRALTAAFVVALLAAIYSAIVRLLVFPQGDGWDAFAIWNLHARFLFRGGAHWRDGFTSLIGGSHPDYPLLLPAAIAHFWTYLGQDDPRVPAVIGFLFTFATVGVLFAGLAVLRGRAPAMLGATALLATPFFIEQGTAQYADVPLAFFFLATVVLPCLYDGGPGDSAAPRRWNLLALAGMAAGFAAWTKNEGLLFLLALVGSRLLILIRARGGTERGTAHAVWASGTALLPMLAGLVPGVVLIGYLKHAIAAPGDLFSDPRTSLHRLFEFSRYRAILGWYGKEFFRFGHWLLIPGSLLLVGLYFVAGKDDRFTKTPGFRTSILALALTLAGYFAIFVITPYDIYWHLRFSLARLFLQLWPSAVFLFFLAMQVPGASGSEASGKLPSQSRRKVSAGS
jgi:hypothetical protein